MELTDRVLIRYTQAYKRGLTHVVKRLEERYPDWAERFETVKKTVTNYVKWLENKVLRVGTAPSFSTNSARIERKTRAVVY